MKLALTIALVGLTLANDVAIVLSGGPSSASGRRDRYYRMLSDGFRMASFCERNHFSVHCLFDPDLVQHFGGEVYSVEGQVNWFTGRTSELRPVSPGRSRRTATYDSLRAIALRNGDRVVLYLRSHGFQGGLIGPRGEALTFRDILNCFMGRGWSGEMLWLVDCCHSGTISADSALFDEAAAHGINCQIITAGGVAGPRDELHTELGISNWRRTFRFGTVSTGSFFRHRLMLAVDRAIANAGGRTWGEITAAIAPQQVSYEVDQRIIRRAMGSLYLSFSGPRGGVRVRVSDWFRIGGGEPTLRRNGQKTCRRPRRHHRVNAALVDVPSYQQWDYGYFKAESGKDDRELAMKSHELYKKMIVGAYKKLGVHLVKPQEMKLTKLTKAQGHLYARILQRIWHRGLSFGPFIPDLRWVLYLVVHSKKNSKVLLDALGSS